MIFYAFFRGRAQNLISELEAASTHVLALLSLQYGKRTERAPAGISDRRRIVISAPASRIAHLASINLRGHAPLHHPGIQLAPLVDVLLLLLIFFLLTWNAARTENELDVKVPKASSAKEKTAPIGRCDRQC